MMKDTHIHKLGIKKSDTLMKWPKYVAHVKRAPHVFTGFVDQRKQITTLSPKATQETIDV